ncbi:MAG: sensor histidine kinase [Pseudomonadota bacterium]
MKINFNSLSFRLVALSTLWTLIVLPVMAFFLIDAYRRTVEVNFDTALRYNLTLLANTQKDEDGKLIIPYLPDPPFTLPFSGRYWQIKLLDKPAENQPISFHSESLLDDVIKLPSEQNISADQNLVRIGYVDGPDNQRLRVIEREISLGFGEKQQRYSFAIAGDSAEIDAELSEYTTKLATALILLGLGLVLAPFVQIHFGLKPLQAISSGLSAIRSGKVNKLEGQLPAEIQPLQQELNALIHSNYEIVNRSRLHVGNLAHALKTPLSVMTNEAGVSEDPFAKKVKQQAQIMQDHIKHHLDRASMAATLNTIVGVTDVYPVMKALRRTLEKIYSKRDVTFKLECPDNLKFRGEKHDLQEIIGNLFDNAGKWARSEILLTLRAVTDETTAIKKLEIYVEDDGPGLSQEQMLTVMKRGKRLDETKPGSGLGLSIVADLVDLYKGTVKLEKSSLGGLKVHLELPAA